MNLITKTALLCITLTITASGVLHSQTDGVKIGVVTGIDQKTAEIIVGTSTAANDIKMGDLLYLRIGGKIVLLRVTFPMQTISKCRAEGKNRALRAKAVKGMTVYRYMKGIEEISTTGKDEQTEDLRDRTYKGKAGGVIHYDTGK